MRISAITVEKLDYVWDEVKLNVERVLETQEKHSAMTEEIYDCEGTKEHIKSGNGLLFVIDDDTQIVASIVVEVLNTEIGRSLNLTSLGGDRIYEWRFLLLDTLVRLAKEVNCQDIRIYMVRRGWQRCLKPFGFESIGIREYAGTDYPVISLNMEKCYG